MNKYYLPLYCGSTPPNDRFTYSNNIAKIESKDIKLIKMGVIGSGLDFGESFPVWMFYSNNIKVINKPYFIKCYAKTINDRFIPIAEKEIKLDNDNFVFHG